MFEVSNYSHFHRKNFSRKERKAPRNLAEDKGIAMNSAGMGSYVIIWDTKDYLREADRQLSDTKIYRDNKFTCG